MTAQNWEIRENDVGTVFTVTVKDGATALDVSNATIKQLKFRDPEGVVTAKTAAFGTDGEDGVLTYTSEAAFLSPAGQWTVWAYVEDSSGAKWNSSPLTFRVRKVPT
jgi:hypothetical protein